MIFTRKKKKKKRKERKKDASDSTLWKPLAGFIQILSLPGYRENRSFSQLV